MPALTVQVGSHPPRDQPLWRAVALLGLGVNDRVNLLNAPPSVVALPTLTQQVRCRQHRDQQLALSSAVRQLTMLIALTLKLAAWLVVVTPTAVDGAIPKPAAAGGVTATANAGDGAVGPVTHSVPVRASEATIMLWYVSARPPPRPANRGVSRGTAASSPPRASTFHVACPAIAPTAARATRAAPQAEATATVVVAAGIGLAAHGATAAAAVAAAGGGTTVAVIVAVAVAAAAAVAAGVMIERLSREVSPLAADQILVMGLHQGLWYPG